MATLTNMARIPELRRRILFTLGMIAIYRLGVGVPAPGVDGSALAQLWEMQGKGTLLEVFNLFSGGALERFSIFALGIMPYISASIILQLLTVVIPHLAQLRKEGDQGRRKITAYTRYLTVVLSSIQGFMMATFMAEQVAPGNAPLVLNPGMAFKIQTMITLASGTAFLMWLGEQMTERGVGNGTSLIITAGIVAGFPSAIMSTLEIVRAGQLSPVGLLLLIVMMVGVMYFIIFFETSQRRIPVQYAKRVVGRKMYQGQSTFLPIKLNMSGVMPPIFASSILVFPATIASMTGGALWMQRIGDHLQYGGWIFNTLTVVLIIFFSYFWAVILFNPEEVSENMKKFGGYVPGIRPGKNTTDYIEKVVERITLVGALYLSVICILPVFLQTGVGISFYFGGTSLLIVVGVSLDTIAQIESHLLAHHYEGFLGPRSSRIKGRRG